MSWSIRATSIGGENFGDADASRESPLGGSSDDLWVLYRSSRSTRAAVSLDTQWQTVQYVLRLWLVIYARITNLAVHSSPSSTPSRALRTAAVGGEKYEATAEYNAADFANYMGQPKVFVWWILYWYSLGTSASSLIGALQLYDSSLGPTEFSVVSRVTFVTMDTFYDLNKQLRPLKKQYIKPQALPCQ